MSCVIDGNQLLSYLPIEVALGHVLLVALWLLSQDVGPLVEAPLNIAVIMDRVLVG